MGDWVRPTSNDAHGVNHLAILVHIETLCGRVIAALKSEALLNESVGAGYIERNWPPALKTAGAWPLASLRQSFLNGSLTRLVDPDAILKNKIVEFVGRGDFGLAKAGVVIAQQRRCFDGA